MNAEPTGAAAPSGAPPAPALDLRLLVVIDTDAANEIDDPFAIAWALLSIERLDVRGVYAVPHSFAHRLRAMRRIQAWRMGPSHEMPQDAWSQAVATHWGPRAAALVAQHGSLDAVAHWPVFDAPGQGTARSLSIIEQVLQLTGRAGDVPALAGSAAYCGPHDPTQLADASPAVQHLVATARAHARPDQPLYVLALGCLTNVAQALTLAPDIAPRLVVVWTAGYPSVARQVNLSFNLEQDLIATRAVLASGVPMVYLPGFQVGAQLRLSLPEMQRFVAPQGALGAWLLDLYRHNPLRDFAGVDVDAPGFSWVIWDLINVAWVLNPAWVPTDVQPVPALDEHLRWQAGAQGTPTTFWREAYAVQRDAIMADLFAKLARYAGV